MLVKQGTVVYVDSARESFLIDDGTGTLDASTPEADINLEDDDQPRRKPLPRLGAQLLLTA